MMKCTWKETPVCVANIPMQHGACGIHIERSLMVLQQVCVCLWRVGDSHWKMPNGAKTKLPIEGGVHIDRCLMVLEMYLHVYP